MQNISWNCPSCGKLTAVDVDDNLVDGKTIEWMIHNPCDECIDKECQAEINNNKLQKFYLLAEENGFPLHHIMAWRHNHPKRNTTIETWITVNREKSLWIAEKNQIGKTFAVIKNGLSELKNGKSVKWLESGQIFRGYLDAVRESEREAKRYFNALAACDLLIIDDLEKIGKITNSAGELLLKLIDRIDIVRDKQMWITTNLGAGEFSLISENKNQAEAIIARIQNRFLFWQGAGVTVAGRGDKV